MASPNLIKDMEEKFFMCSVCLDQFKEPKQLPCLHRYCSECLKTVIQASHDGKIKCPMCKQEYIIPENGVDDFKTDFHMKSMLEFIQLQKSFENKDIKNCVGCSKNTIEEMKKDFPELESLSDFIISDITPVIDDVTITEHEESVVDVEGMIKGKGWWINSVTSNRDGKIVITGNVSNNSDISHITVINRRGVIQRQDQINREEINHLIPFRYCCSLSEFKVVTVCVPDEIGIYDIRDGSYKKKKISDVTSNWPPSHERGVCCVSTDPVNNHIIVGTNSRYVYIYDEKLNYSRTVALPDVISWSRDIIVHRGSLLICDGNTRKAYAVTIDGSESKLMYAFTKPDLGGGDWRPLSVCTDKNEFIYMLYRGTNISVQRRRILVQYGQDGRQILTTRSVDNKSQYVTTLTTSTAEKLIIVSVQSGKLYTYGLVLA